MSNAVASGSHMPNASNAMLRTDGRTNGRPPRLIHTPQVPDAPVVVESVDVAVTRVVLEQLAARQEALAAELERSGLTSHGDRADWLIGRRTEDEMVADERKWAELEAAGGPPRRRGRPRTVDPKPKGRRFNEAEVIEDVEWLVGQGCTPHEVAMALGRSPESLSRWLYRAGRPDLGVAVADPWAKREKAA